MVNKSFRSFKSHSLKHHFLLFFFFRAFDHIFETVSCAEETKFLIRASYCEIYNEEIRDLLGKDIKARLELHEHPEKGVYVNGECDLFVIYNT